MVRSNVGGRRSTPFTGAGEAEPVQDGRVAAEGLDLALHARPGRHEHLVSALLEARLQPPSCAA
jgi:hypothetical protein